MGIQGNRCLGEPSDALPPEGGKMTTSRFIDEGQQAFMNTWIVDLTGRSVPYDRHLVGALGDAGGSVDFWVRADVDLLHGETVRSPLLRVGDRISLQQRRLRKVVKAAEHVVNLGHLLVACARERPDVVHFQWMPLLEIAPVIAHGVVRLIQNMGIPVVYTVHNVLPHDTGVRHREAFQRVYEIADLLICHTVGARKTLVDTFGIAPSSVRVLPHGPLGASAWSGTTSEARRALSIPDRIPLVGLFGGLRPYKGIPFLLDAWAQVHRIRPDARLVLAGSGSAEYEAELRAQIRNAGLEHAVECRFYYLPDEELDQLVQACDVLVYPYRAITQSGALMKGMQSNAAIVSTDVGGLGEILQHGKTALLVEYGNVEGLAKQLLAALQDPERRNELASAAQHEVRTKLSWASIAADTIDAYRAASSVDA